MFQQQETMEIVQKYLNVNSHDGGTVVFHSIPEIPQMAPLFPVVIFNLLWMIHQS